MHCRTPSWGLCTNGTSSVNDSPTPSRALQVELPLASREGSDPSAFHCQNSPVAVKVLLINECHTYVTLVSSRHSTFHRQRTVFQRDADKELDTLRNPGGAQQCYSCPFMEDLKLPLNMLVDRLGQIVRPLNAHLCRFSSPHQTAVHAWGSLKTRESKSG